MSPMKTTQNTRKGIWLMAGSAAIFALQDGVSRHLGSNYSVYMVVMIRFWVFAAFVMLLAARAPGGLRAAIHTKHPYLQAARGLILIVEVAIMVIAFVKLGLIETHAIFACTPLLVAALSGPILGEKVGWRRWTAIAVGFSGVLIILQPGMTVFSPWAIIPLVSAFLFALYGLLTRYVARQDAASVSFFWIGVVGAIAITPFGLWHWTPMSSGDWLFMATLCCTAIIGHGLLIKAYAVAEASVLQPLAYLQLVFIALEGVFWFGESLRLNVAIGTLVVVAASLFTLWRQWVTSRSITPTV